MNDFNIELFIEEVTILYGPSVVEKFCECIAEETPSNYFDAKKLLDKVLDDWNVKA